MPQGGEVSRDHGVSHFSMNWMASSSAGDMPDVLVMANLEKQEVAVDGAHKTQRPEHRACPIQNRHGGHD